MSNITSIIIASHIERRPRAPSLNSIEFKLGARGLRSICEAIMMDVMFDMPEGDVKEFRVTLDYAKSKIDKAA